MSSAIGPDQLVDAVAAFLRDRVLPAVDGDLAFETRVSINALDLVARALRQSPATASAHRYRLEQLLGETGTAGELDALLCERIRSGVLGAESKGLIEHLTISAMDALRVDQPRYSALRRRLAD